MSWCCNCPSYFNTNFCYCSTPSSLSRQFLYCISIQPLLLFNFLFHPGTPSFFLFQYNLCYYSTNLQLNKTHTRLTFQYNLCYYSTTQYFTLLSSPKNFNTTFVIIQRFKDCKGKKLNPAFQYNLCYYSTSSVIGISSVCVPFQYNLCYYSTHIRKV